MALEKLREMDRRTYIYIVTPLVVFLNCGELLVSRLGATLALVVAGVAMVVVWGAVWARLCRQKLRPEFAVMSILPQAIFYAAQCTQTAIFSETPFWGTLYALLWLGCLSVLIVTVLPDTKTVSPWRDVIFLLLIPLATFCIVSGFLQYYPYFSPLF